VVKSLQNLSNDHVYQYIETMNAPAGGAGRRSPVLPPGKMFWLGGWVMQRSFPIIFTAICYSSSRRGSKRLHRICLDSNVSDN
jgi:hypothetical protein